MRPFCVLFQVLNIALPILVVAFHWVCCWNISIHTFLYILLKTSIVLNIWISIHYTILFTDILVCDSILKPSSQLLGVHDTHSWWYCLYNFFNGKDYNLYTICRDKEHFMLLVLVLISATSRYDFDKLSITPWKQQHLVLPELQKEIYEHA